MLIGYQTYGGYSDHITIENFTSKESCYEAGSKIVGNLPLTSSNARLTKSYTCVSKEK